MAYPNSTTQQPRGRQQQAPMQWMQKPPPMQGVPNGLEYLTQIDKLLVQQKVDLLEAFTGWEQNNRYAVLNSVGQQAYFAFEETDTCMRICCGSQRRFTIHIVDNSNQEVLRVHREFKYCAGCCWCAGCCNCCAHEVTVSTPNNVVLGYIRQKYIFPRGSFWKPHFNILDANREAQYNILGPCCICDGACCCCCENNFRVTNLKTGADCGMVSKEYAGLAKECFTKADNFSITFPMDTNVNVKACFLGALFLIDFMYFEEDGDNNSGDS